MGHESVSALARQETDEVRKAVLDAAVDLSHRAPRDMIAVGAQDFALAGPALDHQSLLRGRDSGQARMEELAGRLDPMAQAEQRLLTRSKMARLGVMGGVGLVAAGMLLPGALGPVLTTAGVLGIAGGCALDLHTEARLSALHSEGQPLAMTYEHAIGEYLGNEAALRAEARVHPQNMDPEV